MQKYCSKIGRNRGDSHPEQPVLGAPRPFRAHLSCCGRQMVTHLPQVRQREQHLQLRRVLGQPPVAHLGESKLALDHPKRVLHPRAQARLGPLVGFQHPAHVAAPQRTALTRTHSDVPLDVAPLILFALLNTPVARIAQHHFLLTMQQRVRLRDIVHVGRCAHDRVHQAGHVHANVGLHPEVILIVLLGLMHLGVPRACGVLGGTGRLNDRGIHDRALAHHHALVLKQQVDRFKRIGGDVVLLQQVAKVQDRRLVRDAATGERQLGKIADRSAVAQRLFHGRVRQVEPLLHEVDAQHHFQRVRPAAIARLRIVGLDQISEDLPGDSSFHLGQELLAARHFALGVELGVGKAQLAHRGLPDWVSFNNLHSDRSGGLVQTFPRYLCD